MAHMYSAAESQGLFIDACAEVQQQYLTAVGLTLEQRIHGAIAGVLGIVEGQFPTIPAFVLAPNQDPDYAQANLEQGNDTWPTADLCQGVDISNGLVETWNS